MSEQQFHIYEMNETTDWWMATSPEQARRDYLAEIDLPEDEAISEGCPRQLTESELDEKRFIGEVRNANGQLEDVNRSFREERDRLVSLEPKSQFFASTEY